MKRLTIGICAACILALCVTGVVLIIRSERQAQAVRSVIAAGPANLAREEAAARQEGISLDPKFLQKPLPPPDQNAAPLYIKLTRLLHDKPLNLPKYGEGMNAFHAYTPAQLAASRKILADRQDVMTLIHQAADKPYCVFARDWNQGMDLKFPEYQDQREAVRLLKTESYLLARDGHYKEAVANQKRGFQVAEHAASDGLLISYLVGVANEFITLAGMQSILAQAGPNASVDADVENTVAMAHSRLSLRNAMVGETEFGEDLFVKMHKAEAGGISASLAAAGFSDDDIQKVKTTAMERQNLHDLIDAWQGDYLSRMRLLVVASDQSPRLRRAGYAVVDAQVQHDSDDPAGTVHVFSDILLPALGKIDENDTRIHAREAITLAAAAILAQAAKTGKFPTKLPQEYTDPFNNKPLQYQQEGGNGFVVYSVGPTGHFDGGKPGEKVSGHESLFRYPAVQALTQ